MSKIFFYGWILPDILIFTFKSPWLFSFYPTSFNNKFLIIDASETDEPQDVDKGANDIYLKFLKSI